MNVSTKYNRYRAWFLLLGGGLLAASSFPQLHLPWFAWIAPGLILNASYSVSRLHVFFYGWFAGFVHCLISFHWLLLIPFPWYGAVGWLLLSGWLALFFGAWCWLGRVLLLKLLPANERQIDPNHLHEIFSVMTSSRLLLWSALSGAAWVAMELLMSRLLTGLPFVSLGSSQFRLLPLIQIASFAGVYGISFIVVWVSVSLMPALALLRGEKAPWLRIAIQAGTPLLVLSGVVFFGFVNLSTPAAKIQTLKIALVQPSIPERIIWDPAEETNRFIKLMELSRDALAAKPNLLVWPEAAMPEIIGRNRFTQESIRNLVSPAGAWMVLGLVDMRASPQNSNKLAAFNSAFLIDSRGELAATYDKNHLVMFGEYTPWWLRTFPFLARLRQAADITPGASSPPFQMKYTAAKFSMSICYEDCFPDETRQRLTSDTDFILNLTNDGWFGKSTVQWQHAANAALRSVENGIPLVRCTNNGLTCWFDAYGRLRDAYFPGTQNIYEAAWKMVEVPLRSHVGLTFYGRHGDWFGWGCVATIISASLLCMGFSRNQRKV